MPFVVDSVVLEVLLCSKASEEDELLDDFVNEVDTLTLTLGLSSTAFLLLLLLLLLFSCFCLSLDEKGPKGILTNGVVVVESNLALVEVLL